MIPAFNGLRNITLLTVLLRILIACLCGCLIGLERSAKNRPAGFRTHMLVCIGACTATLTGHYLYLNLGMPADVTRIGAQVITGLGFIGAGTILVTQKGSVKGLTTAAGLWASGVAGLAIGAGFYEGGLIATVMILLVEGLFARANKRIRRLTEQKIILHYTNREALDNVLSYCQDLRIVITALQISGASQDTDAVYSAFLSLQPHTDFDREVVLDHIRAFQGVISAEVS